ncbi:MAG: Asp23/Gls24 family envelope stress response protein, partial [Symbiobacteriaceae bacterium]|nr:Asp23/Gls24 family envelope stress response protein [Symbiobacteriaceae bacterium]
MIITTDFGRIEISEAALIEFVGEVVRQTRGLSEMVPRNLSENLAGLLGIEGRNRGVAIRMHDEGLRVELSMQFPSGSVITPVVVEVADKLREELASRLQINLYELRIHTALVS